MLESRHWAYVERCQQCQKNTKGYDFTIFSFFLFLISCTNNRKNSHKLYTQVQSILYKDCSNNYYFKYGIPDRTKKKGIDVGKTHYIYDSVISFDDSIIAIKNIIDVKSIYTTSEGNIADKNYIYIQYETNIKPKFYVHNQKLNTHFLGQYL